MTGFVGHSTTSAPPRRNTYQSPDTPSTANLAGLPIWPTFAESSIKPLGRQATITPLPRGMWLAPPNALFQGDHDCQKQILIILPAKYNPPEPVEGLEVRL